MSWSLFVSSLILITISSLLISNGSCSQPQRLSASFPVCIGGQLSVESWLAFVGTEFFALGIIIVPRVQSVLLSKILTWRLMSNGISLPRLLNSQTTSPLWTQLHLGLKSTFVVRLLLASIIFVGSILYKFSFVQVGRVDLVNLIGANPPVPMGCDPSGHCGGLSTNLIYAIWNDNSSASFDTTPNAKENSSDTYYTQVFGPSQVNLAHQLTNGDLYFCVPSYYSRNKITSNTSDWNPPPLTTTPINNGIRFTNPGDDSVLDILSSNGTLQILTGFFGHNVTAEYFSMLSTTIEVCLGFASWSVNNTASLKSFLKDPTDITCIPEPFDIEPWTNLTYTPLILGMLQELSWKAANNLPFSTAALNIILASLNHTTSQTLLEQTYTPTLQNITNYTNQPQECTLASSTSSNPWVISGLIPNHGTGMTFLGVILQGLIILFSLFILALLFFPILPLITEWPAQWLGLMYGVSPSKVQEAVDGTSVGKNAAKGDVWVYLGSWGGDMMEGNPYLVLNPEKGRVRMGRCHV